MSRCERWAMVLTLAAACGEDPNRPTPTPPLPPCDQRVTAVRELLAKLPAEIPPGPTLPVVHGAGLRPPEPPFVLPQTAEGVPIDRGFVIALRKDGHFFVENRDVGSNVVAVFDGLVNAYETERAAGRELTVLLAFEAGAKLGTVDQVIPYLRGFPRRLLVVEPPGRAPPREDTLPDWARKKLGEVRRMNDSPGAPVFERLVSCPSLLALEREYQERPAGEGDRMMVTEVPRRIESDCHCRDVDVEGVAALTWLRMTPWRGEVRAMPFMGTIDGVDEPISISPEATIADLLPLLVGRGMKSWRLDFRAFLPPEPVEVPEPAPEPAPAPAPAPGSKKK